MNHSKLYRIFFLTFSFITALNSAYTEKFYEGDGRRDLSIEVDDPILIGDIDEEAVWLPEFVTNLIVDNLKTYSAMTVVDSNNRKRILEAYRNDGIHSKDSDLLDLGKVTVARNLLIVKITVKPSSYGVSLKINDKESNETIAAYNNTNCTYQQLESGKIIALAVEDLLGKLNIQLTAEARKALHEGYSSRDGLRNIEAQKEVARGMVLLKEGSQIQALSHFIKANAQDDKLQRASIAMLKVSDIIATEELVQNTRNLIQQRNDFKKLLDETENYIKETTPVTIVYDSKLELGTIDYDKEMANFDFKVKYIVSDKIEKLAADIKAAYLKQPDHENWKLDSRINSLVPYVSLDVVYQIADKDDRVISEVKDSNRFSYKSYTNIQKKLSFSVGADTDTDYMKFKIDRISKTGDGSSVGVELECVTIDDYVRNYIEPEVRLKELPGIPGVSVLSFPEGSIYAAEECLAFFKKGSLYQLNTYETCGKNGVIFYGDEIKSTLPEGTIFSKNTSQNIRISDLSDDEKIFFFDDNTGKRMRDYAIFKKNPLCLLKGNVQLFYRDGLGYCIGVKSDIYDLLKNSNKINTISTHFHTGLIGDADYPYREGLYTVNNLDFFTLIPDVNFYKAKENKGKYYSSTLEKYLSDAYPVHDLDYCRGEYVNRKEKYGYVMTGNYLDKIIGAGKLCRTINLFSNIDVKYVCNGNTSSSRFYILKVDEQFFNTAKTIAVWFDGDYYFNASFDNFNYDAFVKMMEKSYDGAYSKLDAKNLKKVAREIPASDMNVLNEWIQENHAADPDAPLYLILKTKRKPEKFRGIMSTENPDYKPDDFLEEL